MKISVIIPTYNRINTLKKVIQALTCQTFSQKEFEVVVIDDGSIDATEKEGVRIFGDAQFSSRYIRKDNSGPSAARNLGFKNAAGSLLVLIGDDIIPSEDFLKRHWKMHQNKGDNYVTIGKTTWDKQLQITAFMEALEQGIQFDFDALDSKEPDFHHCYTSNISFKRKFIEDNNLYFDEDMPFAAFEDIEWGYRLQKAGADFAYEKEALGFHHHPVTFSSYKRRMLVSGRALYHFAMKYPELNFSPRSYSGLKSFFRTIKIKFRELLIVSPLAELIFIRFTGISRYRWIRSILSHYEEKGYNFEKNRH